MAFQEWTKMQQRQQMAHMVLTDGVTVSMAARRFGVTRTRVLGVSVNPDLRGNGKDSFAAARTAACTTTRAHPCPCAIVSAPTIYTE